MSHNNEIAEVLPPTEFYPIVIQDNVNLSTYTKLPLENLPALGVAFEPIAAAISSVVNGAGERRSSSIGLTASLKRRCMYE